MSYGAEVNYNGITWKIETEVYINSTLKKVALVNQHLKQVKMHFFVFIFSFAVFSYMQDFFHSVRNQVSNKNIYKTPIELVKRISKVYCRIFRINLFQFLAMRNIFQKLQAYKCQIIACLQNLPRIIVVQNFSPRSFKLKRDILPFSTKYQAKKNNNLWTKFPENFLLAKYVISVAATVNKFDFISSE